jgi:uncharacterized protein (DUF2267 family)
MSQTGLAAFDHTLQSTNRWLHEVMDRMGWTDKHRAYHALRAVLHAVRDRLSVEQAVALGAQLPMLVRGFYYDGWHPHGKPLRERRREDFLTQVADDFQDGPVDLERLTHVVFRVLAGHVSGGEIEDVRDCLTADLRALLA